MQRPQLYFRDHVYQLDLLAAVTAKPLELDDVSAEMNVLALFNVGTSSCNGYIVPARKTYLAAPVPPQPAAIGWGTSIAFPGYRRVRWQHFVVSKSWCNASTFIPTAVADGRIPAGRPEARFR